MPSHYTADNGYHAETLPFTRYHLAEVTGDYKMEANSDIVVLTHQQAQALVDKWNDQAEVSGFGFTYAVYDDVE